MALPAGRARHGDLGELPEFVGQRFEEVVADAVAEARALQPGIEVTGAAVLGDPASAFAGGRPRRRTRCRRLWTGSGSPAKNLVDMSREAGLLIVGGGGRGALVGDLLGWVGQQLLRRADCPVMIVHSEHARDCRTGSVHA